jgi:hypothetical protein
MAYESRERNNVERPDGLWGKKNFVDVLIFAPSGQKQVRQYK